LSIVFYKKVGFADLNLGYFSAANSLAVDFFDARKKCTFLGIKKFEPLHKNKQLDNEI